MNLEIQTDSDLEDMELEDLLSDASAELVASTRNEPFLTRLFATESGQ